MNCAITKTKEKICSFFKKLSRKFDFTLSLRRKKEERPLVSFNVKGEIPHEIAAFFALLGAMTALWGIIKILRKFIS